ATATEDEERADSDRDEYHGDTADDERDLAAATPRRARRLSVAHGRTHLRLLARILLAVLWLTGVRLAGIRLTRHGLPSHGLSSHGLSRIRLTRRYGLTRLMLVRMGWLRVTHSEVLFPLLSCTEPGFGAASSD